MSPRARRLHAEQYAQVPTATRRGATAVESPHGTRSAQLQELADKSPRVMSEGRLSEEIGTGRLAMAQAQRVAGLFGAAAGPRSQSPSGLTSPPPVLQRYTVVYKPFDPEGKQELTAGETFAKKTGEQIDKCVTDSYKEFLSGNFSGASDAQKSLYVLRKYEYDRAKKGGSGYSMHPSTAAGYVIEGKANNKISATLSGVKLQVTDVLDGTRPDIVFEIPKSGGWGLLDITASNSAGHIFMKKGNWTGHKDIPYVAESIYPSIDFDSMKPLELDESQLAMIRKRADDKAQQKREFYDSWSARYHAAQSRVKLQLLAVFNKMNTEPFKGSQRQAARLVHAFEYIGLIVTVDDGSSELTLQTAISFNDRSKPLALEPYKFDEFKTTLLAEALETGSMTKLLRADFGFK